MILLHFRFECLSTYVFPKLSVDEERRRNDKAIEKVRWSGNVKGKNELIILMSNY